MSVRPLALRVLGPRVTLGCHHPREAVKYFAFRSRLVGSRLPPAREASSQREGRRIRACTQSDRAERAPSDGTTSRP